MYDRVSIIDRSYDVMVSILDFESSNPSSNLGRTFFFFSIAHYVSECECWPEKSFSAECCHL